MFSTILVANRGEIAVRVIRTLRAMGIRSVAVYSEADVDALHVQEADTAVLLGPAAARESYLDIAKVVDAAVRCGADAVHPGYGFLSENSAFASALADAGIAFLGPSVHAIDVMGDKITAKNAVAQFGVPVVPGIARPGLTDDDLIAAATDIGYPVLVKPSAGGGGKGMRLVEDPADLPDALVSARREAASSFGDDTLFLERYVLRPRHIEVQILADLHGNIVHLGERECSLQRRHQKVIEEAPSPLLDATARDRIGEAACDTARSVEYSGAGTVEFIVSADKPDEFFFMEMNTRLQVEHPVTEMVTGVDLVEWQVRVAAGEKLTLAQCDITLTGHAIEARVYAEDPGRGFLPTGGTVAALAEPVGTGIRVDSGLRAGTTVGSNYDPMLSKVIAYAPDRAGTLKALDRALASTAILGVVTNIEFARFLLADGDVQAGRLDTGLLDRRVADFVVAQPPTDVLIAAAVYRWLQLWSDPAPDLWDQPSGWRVGTHAPITVRLGHGVVSIWGTPLSATVSFDGEQAAISAVLEGDRLDVSIRGLRHRFMVAEVDEQIWIAGLSGTFALREVPPPPLRAGDAAAVSAEILSPMPGAVIAVNVESGSSVEAGQAIVIVEAMKMEHTLKAPATGLVDVLVAVGDQVKVDQVLARIEELETEK